MKARLYLVLLALPFSMTALGQSSLDEVCKPFSSLQIPEAARPALQRAATAGRGCEAFSLYYSSLPDRFGQARACGLAQLGLFRNDHGSARAEPTQAAPRLDSLSQADGMTLAVMFANGEGVQRAALAAKTLVCAYGFQSQEADPAQLPALFRAIDTGRRLDLCGADEAPQGRAVWFACSAMRAGRAQHAITAAQKRLERSTPAADLPQLHLLEAAWESFAAAHAVSYATSCGGGTGCGVYTAENDFETESKWLTQLKQIKSGEVPPDLPPASAYAAIDKQLNEYYRQSIAEMRATDEATTESSKAPAAKGEQQLRDTERFWLRFREAWVRVAALRWPLVPGDRWRAWLSAIRASELEVQNN